MFGLFKKDKKVIKQFCSVVDGKSIDLSQVEDDMFSNRTLGDGIAIIPSSDEFVAPCDGKILMITETKHAFVVENKDGIQILVHIGLDTVKLKGRGFQFYCKEGEEVRQGKLLLKLDRNLLKEEGYSDVTMMVIPELNGHNIKACYKEIFVEAGKSVLIRYE